MRMIQTYCKKAMYLLFLGTAFVATPSTAFAQYEQGLPWPKTFVGEPDFDFMRDDVIEEYKKKKGGEAHKYISTLNDLLNAKGVDPYIPRPRTSDIGRSKYSKDVFEQRFGTKEENKPFREVYPDVPLGTGLEVRMRSGNIIQAKLLTDTQAQTLDSENPITFDIEVAEDGYVVETIRTESIAETFDKLFLQENGKSNDERPEDNIKETEALPSYSIAVNQLPDIETASEEVVDNLTAFAQFLENIIKQEEKSQKADLKNIDFRQYLSSLVLQSVSTSPEKYAVINDIRFIEGDRIPIRVSYTPKTREDIEKVIDTYMPSQTSLPENIYGQYVNLKNATLEQYEDEQKSQTVQFDELGEKQIVNGYIKRIESRRVILSILEKEYPVVIRFAL